MEEFCSANIAIVDRAAFDKRSGSVIIMFMVCACRCLLPIDDRIVDDHGMRVQVLAADR